MDNGYLTFKELLTGIVVFAIICVVASWIGSDFGSHGGYQYAEPGDSWESIGF